MKKLLLSLVALASFTFAQAEVTLKVIDATDIKGTEVPEKPASGSDNGQAKHVQPLESLKLGAYSFSFTQGTNKSNAPAYYWSMTGKEDIRTIRVYGGNTMTVTAPAGTTMVQIDFKGSNGKSNANPTVTTGSMTVSGTTEMVWKGSASEFTVTYDQTFRITEVTVYVEGETPIDPPTPDVEKVANIAGFIAKCTASDCPTVTIDAPVTVTYQNGRYLYLKDASGVMAVYGDLDQKYENGDVIPAGITGEAQNYSQGVLQMTNVKKDTFKAATKGEAVAPVEISVGAVSANLVSTYVVLRNVTITAAEKANNYTISDEEGDEALLYNQFTNEQYYNVVTVTTGENKTLYAVVTLYKGAPQLYPVKVDGATSVAGIEIDANAPVEYYNLQGVRVANPENGLYIRRQGNTATKVLVK